MSLIAIVVGLVLGLTQRLRPALAAAAVTWVLTTLYLGFLARPPAGEDPSAHQPTARFWLIQAGILVVALVVTWNATRLRSGRVRHA